MAVNDCLKFVTDLMYFMVVLVIHLKVPWAMQAYSILFPGVHYVFKFSLCMSAWFVVAVAFER
jgi:hypothetical protein